MAQKQSGNNGKRIDIVHLGRGKKPYYIERGSHGEFKTVKGPVQSNGDKQIKM